MPSNFMKAGAFESRQFADENGEFEMRSRIKMQGTEADEHEMHRLGREQVLNRNFGFLATLGFACTLMSTWEVVVAFFGLLNGGTAGMIWGYLTCWVGYYLVFASIAEMASMAPTSGGQYHWVSEFAPRRYQRFISFVTGWISVLGWQVGLTSLVFLAGTMIQGLLVLDNDTYVFQRWHGTLLVIAIAVFCTLFNSVAAKILPKVEQVVLFIHILGFFAVLIPLWVMAPKSSASDVFTQFSNYGGWQTTGLSFMVGLLSPVYTLFGADSAVHMSEEIKDASIVLPRAIMWAAGINGTMGFIMVITFCFTLGNILDIVETPTGYPFIQVFYNATNSRAGTSVLAAILIFNAVVASIGTVATASRQTWSFARDHGLPYSSYISYVKPGWNIPLNAVLLTLLITSLLSLINIGSTVAFNAISSLSLVAILGTYIISISTLILRRLRSSPTQSPLPPRRWDMGRAGIFVNAGALAWLLMVWVFCFFPVAVPVTPVSMNWSSVMFVGVMALGPVYFAVYGRKKYTPPVMFVRTDL